MTTRGRLEVKKFIFDRLFLFTAELFSSLSGLADNESAEIE
jgi:hypothetical protein